MAFTNTYEDSAYANAYATLDFPGTYYLAYRDLPEIIGEHVRGNKALDFGCGAGRSTRFLRRLGFETIGLDISPSMIARARQMDPGGDYRLVPEDDFRSLPAGGFNLILSAFTFDNIPTRAKKVETFAGLRRLLAPNGRIISVVSSPEIYLHEWVSFSTRDFPENRHARSGDTVRIIITDIPDRRPVEDIVWSDEAYADVYAQAGLAVVAVRRPLGREDEPVRWVNEARIAPWVIYVLKDHSGSER